jgi:hypothetical protein
VLHFFAPNNTLKFVERRLLEDEEKIIFRVYFSMIEIHFKFFLQKNKKLLTLNHKTNLQRRISACEIDFSSTETIILLK